MPFIWGYLIMRTCRAIWSVFLPLLLFWAGPICGEASVTEAVMELHHSTYDTRPVTPVVEVADDGTFLSVWAEMEMGLMGRIFRRDGTPAGGEMLLVADDVASSLPFNGVLRVAREPVARLTAQGFLVLWTRETAHVRTDIFMEDRLVLDRDVMAQFFDLCGVPEGPEMSLDKYRPGMQRRPALAAFGDDTLAALWESDEGQVIFRRLSPRGTPLAPPVRIDGGASETAFRGSLTIVQGDAVAVVWDGCCDGGGDAGVFGRVLGQDGAPFGPPFLVNALEEGQQQSPAVASAGVDGSALVVWQTPSDETCEEYRIHGRRLAPGMGPLGEELVLSSGEGWAHSDPALVGRADGGWVLAWIAWVGNYREGVHGLALDSDAVPNAESIKLNDMVIDGQRRLGAAVTRDCRMLLSWIGFDADGNRAVKARWMDAGESGEQCRRSSLRPRPVRTCRSWSPPGR